MGESRGKEEAPYVLHAHFDGRHFRMHAENWGDYFDPAACVARQLSAASTRKRIGEGSCRRATGAPPRETDEF
jgi:hypothetical protein